MCHRHDDGIVVLVGGVYLGAVKGVDQNARCAIIEAVRNVGRVLVGDVVGRVHALRNKLSAGFRYLTGQRSLLTC